MSSADQENKGNPQPSSRMTNTNSCLPFECDKDIANVGKRWLKWKKNLESLFIATETRDANQKLHWLRFYGGMRLQEIIDTSAIHTDAEIDSYKKVCEILDEKFLVDKSDNQVIERLNFGRMAQGHETIDQFVMRLRKASEYCGFEPRTDERICEMIILKCTSDALRCEFVKENSVKLLDVQNDMVNKREQAEETKRQKEGNNCQNENYKKNEHYIANKKNEHYIANKVRMDDWQDRMEYGKKMLKRLVDIARAYDAIQKLNPAEKKPQTPAHAQQKVNKKTTSQKKSSGENSKAKNNKAIRAGGPTLIPHSPRS